MLRVASVPAKISRTGSGGSFAPVFSGDGGHVAFISYAPNLVANDDLASFYDVFIRDLASSNTVLVSVNVSGIGGGNDNSTAPSVSSNGQFVAFCSAASNLVLNDTNKASDVFVRDLVRGTTRLVSVNHSTTGTGDGPSKEPRLSEDGRYVVFESTASDLVATDTNRQSDVFVHDLETGTTSIISVDATGTRTGNAASQLLDVTPDCRFVEFFSGATDIFPDADSGMGEIFVRDWQNGVTYWVTTNLSNTDPAHVKRFKTSLSANGRYVVLEDDPSPPSDLLNVYRHDLWNGTTVQTNTSSQDLPTPVISSDGELIAFSRGSQIGLWTPATNGVEFIESWGEITYLSTPAKTGHILVVDGYPDSDLFYLEVVGTNSFGVGQTAPRDFQFTHPTLSRDGKLVAFETKDSEFTPDDWNNGSDVFVWDSERRSAILVSERNPLTRAPATGTALTKLYPRSLSGTGERVLFAGYDGAFSASDTNRAQDLFLRDMATQTNWLLSKLSASSTSPTPPTSAAVSQDGQFAFFDLRVPGSFGPITNAYRLNLLSGQRDLIAQTAFGSAGEGSRFSISADGRFVVFQTVEAAGFFCCAGDDNNVTDLLLRDFGEPYGYVPYGPPTYASVSLNRAGSATGNNGSFDGVVSTDGQWVAFQSLATDLTTNTINGNPAAPHVFVRNIKDQSTRLLDRDTNGVALPGGASNAVFSGNSRYITFQGADSAVYEYDLQLDAIRTGTGLGLFGYQTNYTLLPNTLICTQCSHAALSSDGRFIAYETYSAIDEARNVFVRDLLSGSNELVSINVNGSGPGKGASKNPVISYDGRYVAFESKASDLVTNDFNRASDIFLRDRWKGATSLISMNYQRTASANGPSSNPVLTPFGGTIAFQSFGDDLVPGDYNHTRDIFVVTLALDDADHDGMDDYWELHYFGTMARDGSGDYDQDGYSDLQEFVARTNPTDSSSQLRIISVRVYFNYGTMSVVRTARLYWEAEPGRVYRVQFARNIANPIWFTLPGDITGVSSMATRYDYDTDSSPHYPFTGVGFYRIMVLP